jgi:hypothetical protein
MKRHVGMITVFISSIIISSLLLAVMSSFDIYAQIDNNKIPLPLPTACVFDDEDLPKQDPDDCDPISNNGDALGKDNIFFTLDSSPDLFDTFICTLKDQNNNVFSSGECFKSNTIAEEEYRDLADGLYTFTITASRIVNDNDGDTTDDITQTGVSPEFVFTVGGGSDGGSDFGGGEDPLEAGSQDAAPSGGIASLKQDSNGGFPRLNPIWRTCDAQAIGTDQNVQNGLSGMKYTAKGVISFQDFSQQLRKFNTNNFVLEIYVNFLSGGLVAELYPTIVDINSKRSQSDLYKLDPLLVTGQQAPKDGTKSPNRVPFDIDSVDTECVYQAPKIATSLNIGGVNTHVSPEVFKASNSPFRTCTNPESEAATYSIIFTIRDTERKNILEGHQNIEFVIFQQLTENNPEYYGYLIFNPYENDEERLNLMLTGRDIVTNCRTSLLY